MSKPLRLSIAFTSFLILIGCEGEPGSSCTVAENDDGTATISCDDGSSVTVTSGEDGTVGQDGVDGLAGAAGDDGDDGADGVAGVNGTDCDVFDNGNGTATITCTETSVTLVTCEVDRFTCDGDTLSVCDSTAGIVVLQTCSANECSESLGACDVKTGQVRLAGTDRSSRGRLEVWYNDQWGTVCDDSFDAVDAQVVCRQLGLTGGTVRTNIETVDGAGPIVLDDLECDGTEAEILECPASPIGQTNCIHGEDVGVSCDIRSDGALILSGGGSASGRLGMYLAGVLGTVCDDGFTDVAAGVACRELGYDSGFVVGSAATPDGTGPIHLDDVTCLGNEQRLIDCSWNPTSNCSHVEDVGVSCFFF
jgi:hypothetical protein